MDMESSSSNTMAKLPILKQGEFEMWKLRIKSFFMMMDYALWEVIEAGNSWVAKQTEEINTDGSKSMIMSVPVTNEEKPKLKNDNKARSVLLMALPYEHQITFDQYADAKSMFKAIEARFGGNAATRRTQKTLLKQSYENFTASSSESLDSIFNRLQKLVSQLAVLGVPTSTEDLNLKFLSCLPAEWEMHVVVWMNKPEIYTMSFDELYNNFKIVELSVKKKAGMVPESTNLAFVSTQTTGSSNEVNTAPAVNTVKAETNTASTNFKTAALNEETAYAFIASQPNGSLLKHEDLEQIHEDDLEEMDLKCQLALLSMRARRFYQKTGRKIRINGSDTAGFDKLKVECHNCHKLGHFARECRGSRNYEKRNMAGESRKHEDENISKAMVAVSGGSIFEGGSSFDWSFLEEEQPTYNLTLMAFSDSEFMNTRSARKELVPFIQEVEAFARKSSAFTKKSRRNIADEMVNNSDTKIVRPEMTGQNNEQTDRVNYPLEGGVE
ncbi:hypothetical protein OROGR_003689 [Orobanche gracilis]